MATKSIFVAPLIAAFATFAATSASAEKPMTVKGEQFFQERVSFVDLDLTRRSDQQQLRKRVHSASNRVCIAAFGPESAKDFVPSGYWDAGKTCADFTYRAAAPQIANAIELAKSGRLAVREMTLLAYAR